MATIKHISSKNADYGAAEAYLTFEHGFVVRLQPGNGWQLRKALFPEMPYRRFVECEVGSVLLPVLLRLLRLFQPLIDGLGLSVNGGLPHEFLVGGNLAFQFFQLLPGGVLPGNGGGKGGFHFFGVGKSMLIQISQGLCHLFKVKDGRPFLIALSFALGQLLLNVYKPLWAVGVRCHFRRFLPLWTLENSGRVFLSALFLLGGSGGVFSKKGKGGGLVKIRPQLPGGDGLRPVRREVAVSAPALLNGHALPKK